MANNVTARDASGNAQTFATTDISSVHYPKHITVSPTGANPLIVDDAAFTPGTDAVQMIGATFDDTSPDSVNEGDAGAVRMSANRNLYNTIRDGAGNERGAYVDANGALSVKLTDGGASAVSGNTTADGLGSGPVSLNVNSYNMVYDPTASTFSRQRGQHELTLLSSAARTATTTSADFTNYNSKGIIVVLNITAAAGGGETLQTEIQAGNSIITSYLPLTTGTTQTATGATWVILYPTTMGAGNWNNYVNSVLPKTFRVKVTHSAAGSWTYSVTACMLL